MRDSRNVIDSDEWKATKRMLDDRLKNQKQERAKIKYEVDGLKVMESLKFFGIITESEYKNYLIKNQGKYAEK